MLDLIVSSLPFVLGMFWPALIASVVVAAVTLPAPPARTKNWRVITGIAVALSGVIVFVSVLHGALNPARNVLFRDVVASTFIGLAAPIASTITAFLFQHTRPSIRASLSFIGAVALVSLSSVFLLFVHCTSGDCL